MNKQKGIGMKRVAVITGAASGIGRGMAERFAAEGMTVVLADIEEKPLFKLETELRDKGATVLAVKTDVSNAQDVENLATRTIDAFGAVHILCNNAGVVCSRPIWEHTIADWEWVLGVNLWGVIHGIRTFVPKMLSQNTECHIVNTASILGLIRSPGQGVYKVSKHGVVALSETLADELAQINSLIQVHVLCPGWVQTGILNTERNRPDSLQNPETEVDHTVTGGFIRNAHVEMQAGLLPAEVAEHVVNAIQNGVFYIHTHPEHKTWIQARMEGIVE